MSNTARAATSYRHTSSSHRQIENGSPNQQTDRQQIVNNPSRHAELGRAHTERKINKPEMCETVDSPAEKTLLSSDIDAERLDHSTLADCENIELFALRPDGLGLSAVISVFDLHTSLIRFH